MEGQCAIYFIDETDNINVEINIHERFRYNSSLKSPNDVKRFNLLVKRKKTDRISVDSRSL